MGRRQRGIFLGMQIVFGIALVSTGAVFGYMELAKRDLETQEQERIAWEEQRQAAQATSSLLPQVVGDEIVRNTSYEHIVRYGADIYRNGPVEIVIVQEERTLTEQEQRELCQGEEECAKTLQNWKENVSQNVRAVERFLVSGELKDANNIHRAFVTDTGNYASIAGKVIGTPAIPGLSNARAVLTYEGQDRTPYLMIRIYGKTSDRRFVSLRMNVAEEVNTQMEAIFRTCRHLDGERFWNCARSELRVDMAITNSAWELLEGVIKQL